MTYEQVLMYKKAAKEAEDKEQKKTKEQNPAKKQPKKTGYRRTGKQYSQTLGVATSMVGPTIAGGILGGLSAGKKGAAIGAGIGLYGSTAANAIAALIGKLRRARTSEQQRQVDNSKGRTALHYTVPGIAAYDIAARNSYNNARLAQTAQED